MGQHRTTPYRSRQNLFCFAEDTALQQLYHTFSLKEYKVQYLEKSTYCRIIVPAH